MTAKNVFISYSHADEPAMQELNRFLGPLERNGEIAIWTDRKILPGQKWKEEILHNLETADVILLLVSADFLASNFIHEEEVPRALQRMERHGKAVIPIILNYCLWDHSLLASIQALPKDAQPIASFTNPAQAWNEVARGVISRLKEPSANPTPIQDDAKTKNLNKDITSMSPNNNTGNGNGYALLIGIRYGHWAEVLRPLEGTLKDIEALKSHFTDPALAGFEGRHVFTVTEEEATTQNILKTTDDFVELVNQDPNASSVIIYYSGHGETDGEKSFLVPYDFDLKRWRESKTYDAERVVLSSDFAAKIAAIRARKTLIILDCCHSENIPVGKNLTPNTAFLNDLVAEVESTIDKAAPNERGLLPNLRRGSGKVILTSCEAHETSLDLDSNGLFTSVLLECLKGAGNIENDGWVRLLDIMRYVPREVKARAKGYSNHSQNPVFKRIEDLKADDFVICAYDMAQAKGINLDFTGTKPQTETMVKHRQYYLDLIDEDLGTAFDELDELDWGNRKGMYRDLQKEYIAHPVGFSEDRLRSRLKTLLKHVLK